MRDSMKYWAVVGVTSTILLVAYLCPLLLIGEGTDVVPEEQRQLGLEALAGAGHHFSSPIERLWITRLRLLSFDESLETFVVRAHTLLGIPCSDVEARPRGSAAYVRTVRPRLWRLRRWPRHWA